MAGGRAAPAARRPPQATIARRAKSYGDFYDVVRGYLKSEGEREDEVISPELDIDWKSNKTSSAKVSTEIEFYNWYNGLEDELVQAGNEEYV